MTEVIPERLRSSLSIAASSAKGISCTMKRQAVKAVRGRLRLEKTNKSLPENGKTDGKERIAWSRDSSRWRQ